MPACCAACFAALHTESGLDADVEVCRVEEAVRHFEQITGRRPRILIAKMGQDGHDRWVGGDGGGVSGEHAPLQADSDPVIQHQHQRGC
jgi:hypothetical protein